MAWVMPAHAEKPYSKFAYPPPKLDYYNELADVLMVLIATTVNVISTVRIKGPRIFFINISIPRLGQL